MLKELRITPGKLNAAIDAVIHPLAEKNPWLWCLDAFLHGCVEQNVAETIIKFFRYTFPKMLGSRKSLSESQPGCKAPNWIEGLINAVSSNPEVAGLAASIGAIALGATLVLDDYADLGKLGDERDPPMPHHYQYGLIILLGGVFGTCMSGLALLKRLANNKRLKRLPPSLLEGAPPELIEAFR